MQWNLVNNKQRFGNFDIVVFIQGIFGWFENDTRRKMYPNSRKRKKSKN